MCCQRNEEPISVHVWGIMWEPEKGELWRGGLQRTCAPRFPSWMHFYGYRGTNQGRAIFGTIWTLESFWIRETHRAAMLSQTPHVVLITRQLGATGGPLSLLLPTLNSASYPSLITYPGLPISEARPWFSLPIPTLILTLTLRLNPSSNSQDPSLSTNENKLIQHLKSKPTLLPA